MERFLLLISSMCDSCLASCPPPEEVSVPASQTSYRHPARPGTRYTVSVSGVRGAARLLTNLSSPLVVETVPGRPRSPAIRRVESRGHATLRGHFDYPCPRTGPTEFRLVTDCHATNLSCITNQTVIEDGIIEVAEQSLGPICIPLRSDKDHD